MSIKTLSKPFIFALAMVLVACESGNNAGGVAGGDARTRLSANNSYAEFGDYRIHVNAVLTAELTPEVAQSYDIVRSENQGLVNLVLLRKTGDVEAPVAGEVKASAANLTGQLKAMDIRKIVDGPSIYYIGVVGVENRETINFDFDVQPEGSNQVFLIRFSHEFYTK